MTINIYKNNIILLTISEHNDLVNFFKNKENIKYEITPNLKTDGRHILKYTIEDKKYIIGISDIVAECILNDYRLEWIDE
jgi:hypothetical protein